MNSLSLASAPHTHSRFNVSRTMIAVMVCLSPATAFGLWQFGWPAVFLFLVTVIAALTFEVICLVIAGRPVLRFATDGSAILTGWIVALTLPPWAPWWIGVIGAGLAIVLGKHVFGGLGQNLFNPAMVARAVLLIALPVQMTVWIAPTPFGSPGAPDIAQALAITFGGSASLGFDALSGATPLGQMQSQLDAGVAMPLILADLPSLRDLFQGQVAGSLGETNTLLLLIGGLSLVLLRIISIAVPAAVLGTFFALSGLAWLISPDSFPPPALHLTSGAVVFCAFFIATDYVTSPVSLMGRVIFGAGVGALIFVIRSWGSFPEGVAFAVLLMNACTPLIDAYTRPRVFGRQRNGKALELEGRT